MKTARSIGNLIREIRGLIVIGLAVGLLTAMSASAADIYVSTNGTPAADYDTWANAFTNLQEALDYAASEGDVTNIYVAGETFWLTDQIEWTISDLTIRGGYEADPGGVSPGSHNSELWPTVLARSGGANHRILYINGVSGGELENVTLTGGALGNSGYGGGVHIAASASVTLSGCMITNNLVGAGYSRGGGVYVDATSHATLTNCLIAWNTSGSGERPGAAGIHALGTLTVRDSRILHNRNLETRSDYAQGGGVYYRGSSAVFKNVLVANNYHARGIGAGLDVDSSTTLENCSVVYNLGEGVRNAGNVNNSIVWGNMDDVAGTVNASHSLFGDVDLGGNNLKAEPQFEYGYYLAAGSPAIGAGSDTAANLGLAGYTTRVDGGTYAPDDTVNLGFHALPGTVFDLAHADLYVAESGNDGNDGTSSGQPFRTITKALAEARDGSRIHVAAGVYSAASGETLPLQARGLTGLRILGAGAATAVLHGADAAQVLTLSFCPAVELADVSVTRGRHGLGGGFGIEYSAAVSLSGCAVTNNAAPGNAARGGGIYAIGSGLSLSNCLVAWNTVGGGERVAGAGIWVEGSGNRFGDPSSAELYMANSRIANNRNLESRTSDYRYGGGVFFHGTRGRIWNCLVTGNDHPRSPGGAGLYVNANMLVHNSTIAYNTGDGIHGAGSVSNCIVWGNYTDLLTCSDVRHSIVGDPTYDAIDGNRFADPQFEYGYYLAAGSPAIGAGSDTAANLGLAGYTTRVDGGTYAPEDIVNLGFHALPGTVFDLAHADLYVAESGNDGNDGTSSGQPFRTITKALAEARDGTRIHVAAGVYNVAGGEVFPLRVDDLAGVHITGADADDTVLDAQGSGQPVVSLTYAHIASLHNLTLTRGENDGGGARLHTSHHVAISGCNFQSNRFSFSRSAPMNGGGMSASRSSAMVSNSVFRGNFINNTVNHSQGFARGGGLWSDGPITVLDTILVDNEVKAATVRGQGGGLYFTDRAQARLRNVLIYGNKADQAGDGMQIAAGTVVIDNCTVADNNAQGIRRDGGSVTLRNGIVWGQTTDINGDVAVSHSNIGTGGYPDDEPDEDGNISADPFFVDPLTGNYRLQTHYGRRDPETDNWIHDAQTSPCIDAGTNLDWHDGGVDLDGAPRLQRGRYETVGLVVDMGAYEQTYRPRGTIFFMR